MLATKPRRIGGVAVVAAARFVGGQFLVVASPIFNYDRNPLQRGKRLEKLILAGTQGGVYTSCEGTSQRETSGPRGGEIWKDFCRPIPFQNLTV